MAGFRIEIFGNLIERHNTLPVRSGTNSPRPVIPMNIVCMDYDSVTARKRMAVSQCNIFVCFLQGADLAEEVQRRAVGRSQSRASPASRDITALPSPTHTGAGGTDYWRHHAGPADRVSNVAHDI